MIKLPRYQKCFVCGGGNTAGLDVQFYRDDLTVTCEWTPDEKHLGYRDRVHGGVTASILDEAMGWTPSSEYQRLCFSIELNVKYRRPVPTGKRLSIIANVVELKRRAARTRGELVDAEGIVYATGSGVYVPLPAGETEKVLAYLHIDGEKRPVTVSDF